MTTDLKSGDFQGLPNLRVLNMRNSLLNSLPDGLFEGVTDLHTVRMTGNRVPSFAITVSLVADGDTAFKLLVDKGAPFPIRVDFNMPDAATYGSTAVKAKTTGTRGSSFEIPAGTTESERLVLLDANRLDGNELASYTDIPLSLESVAYVDPLAGVDGALPFEEDRAAGHAPAASSAVLTVDPDLEDTSTYLMTPSTEYDFDAVGEVESNQVKFIITLERPIPEDGDPVYATVDAVPFSDFYTEDATWGADFTLNTLNGNQTEAFEVMFGPGDRTIEMTVEGVDDDLIESAHEGFKLVVQSINLAEDWEKEMRIADGVCDRTPEVRDALLELLDNRICSDPDIHNGLIQEQEGTLTLNSVTSLKPLDFLNLHSIDEIDLSKSPGLETLPDGIFNGLSLSRLRFNEQAGPFELLVWLETVPAPEGWVPADPGSTEHQCHVQLRADKGLPFPHTILYQSFAPGTLYLGTLEFDHAVLASGSIEMRPAVMDVSLWGVVKGAPFDTEGPVTIRKEGIPELRDRRDSPQRLSSAVLTCQIHSQ